MPQRRKRKHLPPYAVLAEMRSRMTVAQMAERHGWLPNSIANRLRRGPTLLETREHALRRHVILDCWAEGSGAKDIARAVSMSHVAVFGVIARARAAGDPRATPRYRERKPS
jgi:hypothetical protein